jgi:hypothetical protein
MFQIVILICFRLQTSFLLFALFICLFVFAPNPYLMNTFRHLVTTDNTLMIWSVVFLAVSTFLTFRLPRQEGFRRHLCGKTVMSFVDMGSPVRAISIVRKLKMDELRRESADMEQRVYGKTLTERFPGIHDPALVGLFDELTSFYHRTNWKYALINMVFFTLVVAISNALVFNAAAPATILLLPLIIIYEQLYTYFFRQFSPMLPLSRKNYFRINLYKGVVVYVATILLILLLLGMMRFLHVVLPVPVNDLVQPFALMPLRSVFYFALAAPMYSWIFIVMRGMASYLALAFVFAMSALVITIFLFDDFLQLNPVLVCLITVLFFTPYVMQSHIRCMKSDLIRF